MSGSKWEVVLDGGNDKNDLRAKAAKRVVKMTLAGKLKWTAEDGRAYCRLDGATLVSWFKSDQHGHSRCHIDLGGEVVTLYPQFGEEFKTIIKIIIADFWQKKHEQEAADMERRLKAHFGRLNSILDGVR